MLRTEDLAAVIDKLVGQTFGSITVINGRADLEIDVDGQLSIIFEFKVSDPVERTGTWSLEDVDEIQHQTRLLTSEADPESPYAIVKLLPETPDQEDDSGGEPDSGLVQSLERDQDT